MRIKLDWQENVCIILHLEKEEALNES